MVDSAVQTRTPIPVADSFAMVNFQRTPKPRNYLARREQWRLLVLVMALGLVLILMAEARKPHRWHWITTLGSNRGDRQAALASADQQPIDTRVVKASPGQQDLDTFYSSAPLPEKAEKDISGRYFPGVKPEYLKLVRDDTTFRPQEEQAWFNLLGILKNTDDAALRRASTGRTTFTQLFKQSRAYRGELVDTRGTVRRVHQLPTPENEHGIRRFYQVWLFPDDNPSSPMVVYCLHLPEDFPTGMQVEADVELTGFFFKRWLYPAVDSLRRAPTLVARTVRWHKRPARVEPTPPGPGTWLLLIGMAFVVSTLAVAYVYKRTRTTRLKQQDTPPDFGPLRDVEPRREGGPLPETPSDQEPEP